MAARISLRATERITSAFLVRATERITSAFLVGVALFVTDFIPTRSLGYFMPVGIGSFYLGLVRMRLRRLMTGRIYFTNNVANCSCFVGRSAASLAHRHGSHSNALLWFLQACWNRESFHGKWRILVICSVLSPLAAAS
jgi:hypothetical protein